MFLQAGESGKRKLQHEAVLVFLVNYFFAFMTVLVVVVAEKLVSQFARDLCDAEEEKKKEREYFQVLSHSEIFPIKINLFFRQ